MRRLLALKLKTIQFFDSISGTLKDTVEESKGNNDPIELATNKLTVNINKVENPGLTVYVKGMLLSEECKNDYNAIKSLHGFNEKFHDFDAYVNVIADIKEGSASAIAEEINEVLSREEVKATLTGLLKGGRVSVIAIDGNKLNVAFPFPALAAKFLS